MIPRYDKIQGFLKDIKNILHEYIQIVKVR